MEARRATGSECGACWRKRGRRSARRGMVGCWRCSATRRRRTGCLRRRRWRSWATRCRWTRAALRRWAAKAPPAERVLLNWLEWQGGDAGARGRLVEALGEADAVARLRAAFVLRFTGTKEPAALAALGAAADREVEGAASRAFVVGAAYALGASAERMPVWREILEETARSGPPAEAYEALQALSSGAGRAELEQMRPMLEHAHGDIRVAAAWLMLAVVRREP